MSPHVWSEDQLVEQPAIGLFAAPSWQVAAQHPHLHPNPLPGEPARHGGQHLRLPARSGGRLEPLPDQAAER